MKCTEGGVELALLQDLLHVEAMFGQVLELYEDIVNVDDDEIAGGNSRTPHSYSPGKRRVSWTGYTVLWRNLHLAFNLRTLDGG